jgi:hypothetical protein
VVEALKAAVQSLESAIPPASRLCHPEEVAAATDEGSAVASAARRWDTKFELLSMGDILSAILFLDAAAFQGID